jgi:hypothetical protein
MGSVNGGLTVPTREQQQSALQAVVNSAGFSKTPRLIALLEYLCRKRLHGEISSVKEYSIATDVFGRSSAFDPSTDAIVRVEMHRLRKKLKEFYAGEGAGEPVEIAIHNGSYVPEFLPRNVPDAPESALLSSADESSEVEPVSLWQPTIAALIQPSIRRTSWIKLSIFGVIAGLIAILSTWYLTRWRSGVPVISQHAGAPLAAAAAGPEIRILCGSSQSGIRDRKGRVWGADEFFSGGRPIQLDEKPVYRTKDPFLFHSMRCGEFSYKIPLKPGIYELHLYFSDSSYVPGTAMDGGENTRVFNVSLNGNPLLTDFDIIADAGADTADERVFTDVRPAADGFLHLNFSKIVEKPLLNAIEIVPGIAHRMHPVRLTTQDVTILDRTGTYWQPDNYFLNGRTISRYGLITGPDDPRLYERERYGNFSYAIPVAPGRYTAKLHFAESYWGSDAEDDGGTGSRIFDVYCNGVALIRDLDIYKEAGSHHQLTKSFSGLRPNAQGKLLFQFVPTKNYANISAIEVIPESN